MYASLNVPTYARASRFVRSRFFLTCVACALAAIAAAITYLELLELSIFNPPHWVTALLNLPDWAMALLLLASWFLPVGWILLPELKQPNGVESLSLNRFFLISLGFFVVTAAIAFVILLIAVCLGLSRP